MRTVRAPASPVCLALVAALVLSSRRRFGVCPLPQRRRACRDAVLGRVVGDVVRRRV